MSLGVDQSRCEAISRENYKIARNCIAYMLDFIVMIMAKVNRKGLLTLSPGLCVKLLITASTAFITIQIC